jgi:site-specific recombinase XerD
LDVEGFVDEIFSRQCTNEVAQLACYRAFRTFLYWWEEELEPEGWKNPIRRVKPPKLSISPPEPADLEDIKAMVDSCDNPFNGKRDKAILLSLLDIGARAHEFLALNIDDLNYTTGALIIREGKGGKFRSVFLGEEISPYCESISQSPPG